MVDDSDFVLIGLLLSKIDWRAREKILLIHGDERVFVPDDRSLTFYKTAQDCCMELESQNSELL